MMKPQRRSTARSRAAVWQGAPQAGALGASLRERLTALLDLRAALAAEADGRRLFLWLPVAMGAGIILCFRADGVPSPWPAAAAGAALSAAAWRLKHRLPTFAALVSAAFVFLGFAAAAWKMRDVAAPVLDRPAFATLSGFVEQVDAGPAGGRMVIRLTSFETSFPVVKPQRVRVTIRGAPPRAGDHVGGRARLVPPPQPAFPGGYDFARDAYFLGLGAVGRWTGPIALAPAPGPAPLALRIGAAIDNARTDMTNRIASVIGGQAGALSAALVTGKRGLIEARVNDDMRAAGIYHIVSISGLHMVLAAGVFFWLARAALALPLGLADRRPIKKWAAVVAMLGATAYCIFSGSEVATERSLIMTLTMLGAILVDRPALSMRNLAISALIVLAREPETLLGPSFQMSFAAVAAMIAAHEWWRDRQRDRKEPAAWGGILLRKLWIAVAGSLATTLIASIATAPFAAFHFQRWNPYGLVGNALAIPFVSFVVMPAAVAGTLLMPFGLDGPVWQLMGVGSQRVVEVAAYVAAFEGAVRGLKAFPAEALLLIALGFVILVLPRAPARVAGLAVIAAGVWLAARPKPPDLMIDRDGRSAVYRGADGRLAYLGRGSSRFTLDRWLAADGDLRQAADASLRAASRCDGLGCVGKFPDGAAIALVLEPEAFEEDCRKAAVVITPLRAPPFCKKTAEVIDQERLSFSASLAIQRSGGRVEVTPARPVDRWKPWFGRPQTAAAPAAANEPERNEPARNEPDPDREGADLLSP